MSPGNRGGVGGQVRLTDIPPLLLNPGDAVTIANAFAYSFRYSSITRISSDMRFRCLLLAVFSLTLWSRLAIADAGRVELFAGMHRISAEVASDYSTRAVGLMDRAAMLSYEGMIFVYPEKATHCMWMRNTLIPLSVAFLDDDGTIINIEKMTPQTDDNHCARSPARFALEMNAGWFAARGIQAGARIKGVEALPEGR